MSRERDMRQTVGSHRVMAAVLERDRVARLAQRQDEHIAREKLASKEQGNEPEN